MSTKNEVLQEEICDVLMEISNITKMIAVNLKKINKLKGVENGKNEKVIITRTRVETM